MSLLKRLGLARRPAILSKGNDATRAAWREEPDGSRRLEARCTVCGREGTFVLPAAAVARESLLCPSCGTTARYRSVARGVLRAIRELRGVTAVSLQDLASAPRAAPLRVYDTQTPFACAVAAYPIPALLAAVPWIDVATSTWRPELPPGTPLGGRSTNQNLEGLTFPDASFDIVITSDVMEHVRLEASAHAEIRRVLRPGGVYLFTVPFVRWQYNDIVRVLVNDSADASRDEHLLPPDYHGDPNDPSDQALVFRVFGSGLDRRLRELGFSVSFAMEDALAEAIVDAELFYCRLPGGQSALRLTPHEMERPARPPAAPAGGPGRSPRPAERPAFPDGHHYSPVVAIAEAERDRARIWPPLSNVLGIDFREAHHRELLEGPFVDLLGDYDYPFGPAAGAPPTAFYEGNDFFNWLDPKALFVLLRHLRPRRMVEIGAGYSSLLAADVNRRFLGGAMELTCIEPHLPQFLRGGVAGISRLIERRVQDVPLSDTTALAPGDVLFIDSSHVAKTGSDVNHLVFEVLPRLAAGVFVHFHDVFLPHDYPPDWVIGEGRSWNEQYLVRALLMSPSAFQVYFSSTVAFDAFPDLVARATRRPAAGGSSLWICRRA